MRRFGQMLEEIQRRLKYMTQITLRYRVSSVTTPDHARSIESHACMRVRVMCLSKVSFRSPQDGIVSRGRPLLWGLASGIQQGV